MNILYLHAAIGGGGLGQGDPRADDAWGEGSGEAEEGVMET